MTTRTFIARASLAAMLFSGGVAMGQSPTSPHQQQPTAPAAPSVTEAQYRVFRADGRAATLDDVIAATDGIEVLFIGEEHDDPGAHFLEAELLKRAFVHHASTSRRSVTLSLEMFERDVQGVLDEYLAGLITEKHFKSSSRPWKNYDDDYRPMVEFAREHKLRVVAANAPQRYANRASRLGRASLDELSPQAKAWIAPLPYGEPHPAYAAKFEALMAPPPGQDGAAHGAAAMAHGPLHLIDGQSLWDATMAYSIAEHLLRDPSALVLHVDGKFHSDEKLGVPYHLARYRPGTRVLVVSVVSGEGFPQFDAQKLGVLGDFVILTDPSLKKPETN